MYKYIYIYMQWDICVSGNNVVLGSDWKCSAPKLHARKENDYALTSGFTSWPMFKQTHEIPSAWHIASYTYTLNFPLQTRNSTWGCLRAGLESISSCVPGRKQSRRTTSCDILWSVYDGTKKVPICHYSISNKTCMSISLEPVVMFSVVI